MQLLNLTVFLFVGLCTANSDLSSEMIKYAGKQGVSACADMCFAKMDNSTRFIYTRAGNMCTCRTAADETVFDETIEVDATFDEAREICSEWCYQVDDPATVDYVFYDRSGPRCYCVNNENEIILNIYLNNLEKMKECYGQCTTENIRPKQFHYDSNANACNCNSQ